MHKSEVWEIEKLKGWDRNPRTIEKKDLERLKRQIQKHGVYKPLIVTPDGEVIGGNMRLKALTELGAKEAWVSVVEPKTEAEKVEIALSDNDRVGRYDKGLLEDLVIEFKDEISLDDFSVDLKAPVLLDELVSNYSRASEKEDDVPEAPKEPISRPGDLWVLGDHRLLCGDSTKMEDVDRLMAGEKADMVFTDPPYNVDYGASKNPRHKIRTIENDKQSPEEWKDFCNDLFLIFKEFNKGDIYMWGASGPEGMKMRLWLTEMGCHWSATIVWKKQQLVLSPANYQRMYEPCFYGWFDKSSW